MKISVWHGVMILTMTLAVAQKSTADGLATRCKAMSGTLDVQDAPMQIREAKLVSEKNAREYCEVRGQIESKVEFVVRLPTQQWNGKFVELGCGGTCGSTAHISACAGPLSRSYACIVSDGGTKLSGLEMTWAYNNQQAVVEYLVNSPHITALAGKAVTKVFYGKAPRESYFLGCSAGGIQAMFEAQRFPWDFDGIVAGSPSLSLRANWINRIWAARALIDENNQPVLTQQDLEFVHRAVISACDLNDGVRDGLIGDPRMCSFDPSTLLCTEAGKSQCLSAQKVAAIKRIYDGPHTSSGERITLPTALRGSEQYWLDRFGSSRESPAYHYTGEWFRYYFLQPNPGALWQPTEFDFDQDYKRLGLSGVTEPLNADLREFRARGGKLLMFTGWSDAGEGVLRDIDYYEAVERLTGDRASTQAFLRLFVVPGMYHCTGGEGPYVIDYFGYLERWVELGNASNELVGLRPTKKGSKAYIDFWGVNSFKPSEIEFSRPIYPYPLVSKYSGRGDPNDARNYFSGGR